MEGALIHLGLMGQATFMVAAVCLLASMMLKSKYVQGSYVIFCGGMILALALLVIAHMTSDLSLLIVLENTHEKLPWYFKLGAVWSSHEGSMLLWVVLLAKVLWLVRPHLTHAQNILMIRLHSFVLFQFLIFMIMASDPFQTLAHTPPHGEDLNPVLQDPSLLIHPPLLYCGTALTCIPFLLSLLTLVQGRLESSMLTALYHGTLLSWIFVTLGLTLGSFWAYYELGWGGFWFWDPVETLALIPWLLLTALLHKIVIARPQRGRGNLFGCYTIKDRHTASQIAMTNVVKLPLLWGLLPFLSVVLSLILIRSGLLTSVHSFAVDENRGVFLSLAGFMIMGMVLWIYGCFKDRLSHNHPASSKGLMEHIFHYQGLLLLITAVILLTGVLVAPLAKYMGKVHLSLDFDFFNDVFLLFMTPVCMLMIVFSRFKKGEEGYRRILKPFIMSALMIVIYYYFFKIQRPLELLGLFLSLWILTTSVWDVFEKPFINRRFAMILAHGGVGVLILGITCQAYHQKSFNFYFDHVGTQKNNGFTLALQGVEHLEAPLYQSNRLHLVINNQYKVLPERRYYFKRNLVHDEVAIQSTLFSHYYVSVIHDQKPYSLHLEYKPLINLIWLGAFFMILGGVWGYGYCLKGSREIFSAFCKSAQCV